MQFRLKHLYIYIGAYALFFIIFLIFTIRSINSQKLETLHYLEELEIERTKKKIKNYVYIANSIIQTNYNNSIDNNFLKEKYGEKLRTVVSLAESILTIYYQKVQNGQMSEHLAKKKAIEIISKININQSNYVWIFTNDYPFPRMVFNPTLPHQKGKIMNDSSYNSLVLETNLPTHLYTAIITKVNKHKDEYLYHLWAKPGSKAFVPKLSHFKLFRPWNWCFGTGIYVDDAINDAYEKTIKDLKALRWNDDSSGYFFLTDTTSPIPRRVMNPNTDEFNGEILKHPKFNTALDSASNYTSNLFEICLDSCKKNSDGFIQYLWTKPFSSDTMFKKITYVKLVDEFGWMLGTGIYTDDIEKQINKFKQNIDKQKQIATIQLIMFAIPIIIIIFLLLRNGHKKLVNYFNQMVD